MEVIRRANQVLKNRIISFTMAIILIIIFGIFIYPGIYKYDKLNQNLPVKINRLTGNTKILTATGWADINTPTLSEIKKIENNISNKFEEYKTNLNDELIRRISNESISKINAASDNAISEIQKQLSDIEKQINTYQKVATDPNSYFTIGSTKDEVKKIMGTPTSINSYFDTWYYGSSLIEFKNNKVKSYSNFSDNLKVK